MKIVLKKEHEKIMKYCKKCLQPDTRPGIYFSEEGVCGACLYEEEKKKIDWDARQAELVSIAEWAKAQKRPYDCVIGVSGGKDSTFQAVYAKEKLGLKVLLINCEPNLITEVGKYNIENLINMGFDCIKIRPNPLIERKLAKKSFYEYGNIVKASEYPLWVSAYRMALAMDIPLIIQGENASLTLGVSKTGQGCDGDAFNVTKTNTLRGCTAEEWMGDGVSEDDLFLYRFPSKEAFEGKNIRAIWLQYYVKEWSQVYNADFSIARGLRGRSNESLYDLGRYRRYSALDSDFAIPNQMIKYFKFGFGFATDEACYDIREGRISREDAKWLVEQYDGRCGDKYIESFCDYIGITKGEFWRVVDNLVNKELFEKEATSGKWRPKFKIGEDYNE